jgi:hypothetical protein
LGVPASPSKAHFLLGFGATACKGAFMHQKVALFLF